MAATRRATTSQIQLLAEVARPAPAASDVVSSGARDGGEAFRALGEAGAYYYDSAPPSRAIVAFRLITQDPARTVAFAHVVQQALFRDGLDLNEAATYVPLLAPFEVDAVEFTRRWTAPETAQAARQEFAAVARIGVQGFPTAVVRIGEQGYVLARGYQPYEQLRAGLEQLLRETA